MKAHYKDGLQNGIEEWYSKDRTLYLKFLCTKGVCEKIHEKSYFVKVEFNCLSYHIYIRLKKLYN